MDLQTQVETHSSKVEQLFRSPACWTVRLRSCRRKGRSEREVPQLLDLIGEVHSNMSSTNDVIVVSHGKKASTHVAGQRRTSLDVAGKLVDLVRHE